MTSFSSSKRPQLRPHLKDRQGEAESYGYLLPCGRKSLSSLKVSPKQSTVSPRCFEATLVSSVQVIEIKGWEKLLMESRKEVQREKEQRNLLLNNLQQTQTDASSNETELMVKLEEAQEDKEKSLQEFAAQKDEIAAQRDHLLDLLKEREGVALANNKLVDELKCSAARAADLEGKLAEAEARALTLEKRLDYVEGKKGNEVSQRDALTSQLRALDIALAEAQGQNQVLRSQMAQRQSPIESLLFEARRLRADNERLVALLSDTTEWRRLAKEMAGGVGLHYIPVEELLIDKGMVGEQYVPLNDRKIQPQGVKKGTKKVKAMKLVRKGGGALVESGEGGADADEEGGGEEEEESWSWIPRQAIDATKRAISIAMPTAPIQPLLGLLLQLNKIWRKRESDRVAALQSAHDKEVRSLHELYRQRAPYETVVGKTRLSELKRQLRLQVEHANHLAAKADKDVKDRVDDTKISLQLGLDAVNTLSKEVKKMNDKKEKLRKALVKHERNPPICQPCIDQTLNDMAQDHSRLSTLSHPYPQRTTAFLPAGGSTNSSKPVQIKRPTAIDEVLDQNHWMSLSVATPGVTAPNEFSPAPDLPEAPIATASQLQVSLPTIQEVTDSWENHERSSVGHDILERIRNLGAYAGPMVVDHLEGGKIKFPLAR